jgi:MFS transporter, CP family, cyanate transporter
VLIRLGGEHVLLLYGGVVVAGAGIAVAGTVLPGIVKEFFPGRAGTMTGVYMASMMAGATVAAAFSVPLAQRLGSWERSLAFWSLLAVAGLAVWTPVTRRVPPHRPTDTGVRLPWGDHTAWIVAAYVSLNSVIFYTLLAWLAPLYEQRGRSAAGAGLLVAALSLAQLVAALVVPTLADRSPDRRPGFGIATGSSLVGLLWLLMTPGAAPYVMALVLGFGLGAGFTLGLVLLVDYAPDPTASARLSALTFLVSYLSAAMGPLLGGALRDTTGAFTATIVVLVVLQVGQILLVSTLRPGRLVH